MSAMSVLSNGYQAYGCKPNQVEVFSEATGQKICNGNQCSSSKDPVAKKLYSIVLKLLHFLKNTFGVCGVDGKGSVPDFYIHWAPKNAQWISQGAYGKFRFNDVFACMPTVVAHEFTHGMVHHFGRLNPLGESGALNESISDVFGTAFQHWLGGNKNDWAIGGDLRDLAVHADMTSFAGEEAVHENSKIPSHAFYMAVKETKTDSFGVLAKIWFRALYHINPDASFKDFAIRTLRYLEKMPALKQTIAWSWVHVGVLSFVIHKPPAQQKKLIDYKSAN
jgi:Zn-dependent metalloprotease